MPALNSYDYALVRLLPDIERGECINIGIILFCRTRRFLDMRIHLEPKRITHFAPTLDMESVKLQLDHLLCICAGGKDAGPIGTLSQSERFHWLVSPRSTIIQTSPVHSGLCSDPAAQLQRLLEKLVSA